jgi:hypothetical protein
MPPRGCACRKFLSGREVALSLRSQPSTIAQAFLAQPLCSPRIARREGTLSLLIVQQPAAIGPLLWWRRVGWGADRYCDHQHDQKRSHLSDRASRRRFVAPGAGTRAPR